MLYRQKVSCQCVKPCKGLFSDVCELVVLRSVDVVPEKLDCAQPKGFFLTGLACMAAVKPLEYQDEYRHLNRT